MYKCSDGGYINKVECGPGYGRENMWGEPDLRGGHVVAWEHKTRGKEKEREPNQRL